MNRGKQGKIEAIEAILRDLSDMRSEQTDQTNIILIDCEIERLKSELNQALSRKTAKQDKNRSRMFRK